MADVVIPFTIPDALVSEMIDVFGEDYQSEIPNPEYDPSDPDSPEAIANPQNKASFAKNEFKRVGVKAWTNTVRRYRIRAARAAISDAFDINS